MSSSRCLQSLVHLSARTRVAKPAVQNLSNHSRSFQTSKFVQSKITQNSWAAERFAEMGVKLPEGETLPETRLSTEALYAPSDKVLKLSDEFLSLNMVECVQLMSEIQTRLGESVEDLFGGIGGGGGGGGGGAAAGGAAAAAPEPAKVKDAFDLKLTEVDAKAKIKIIKEVRAITGLGLKEAKDMVEGAPVVVKQGLKKDEAEKLLKVLIEAGAKAELL